MRRGHAHRELLGHQLGRLRRRRDPAAQGAQGARPARPQHPLAALIPLLVERPPADAKRWQGAVPRGRCPGRARYRPPAAALSVARVPGAQRRRPGRGVAQEAAAVTSAPLPRILRRRGEPEYPTFLELFFDLVYIFMFSRLAASLAEDLTVRGAAQTAVLLLAAWWVWVLTAWLTDLFNPRLPIIQATVLLVMLGTLLMAIATPYAFGRYGWLFVAAYFAIHLVRDAVLIPGTRVNRPIQARSIRVFFWFGVTVDALGGRGVRGRDGPTGALVSRGGGRPRLGPGRLADAEAGAYRACQPDLHRSASLRAAPGDLHRRARRVDPEHRHGAGRQRIRRPARWPPARSRSSARSCCSSSTSSGSSGSWRRPQRRNCGTGPLRHLHLVQPSGHGGRGGAGLDQHLAGHRPAVRSRAGRADGRHPRRTGPVPARQLSCSMPW